MQSESAGTAIEELLGLSQDTGDGHVALHDGQFRLHAIDLEIPGRGFTWKFERTYRSGIFFYGPLGNNWEFNYNRRLFVDPHGAVVRMDGYGRADRYEPLGDSFLAPPGYYTQLARNGDGTFTEWDRYRNQAVYSIPDNTGMARMTELSDRNGNRMRFAYNAQGQLVQVTDSFERPIKYYYNALGQLVEVADFIGRKMRFEYDDNGDLVSVTSPSVVGTPTRNDFPTGKITRYHYTSGFSDERLNHNLTEVFAPNEVAAGGPPRVQVKYETDLASPDAGRVRLLTLGGMNANGVAAGGSIAYEYLNLGSVSPADFAKPVLQTNVVDRNENRTEYQFDQLGYIMLVRELANRNIATSDSPTSAPPVFVSQFEYNKDGEMTRLIRPEGNSIEYVYDDQNPDRLQQGNMLAESRLPDPKRGGDQEFIKTTYTYDPIYNQRSTVTEARGNDPSFEPQNGGKNSPERYRTVYIFDYQEGNDPAALARNSGLTEAGVKELLSRAKIPVGLGDVNGDQDTQQVGGNIVKVIYPTVNLLPDSNMEKIEHGTLQPVEETFTYNQFGQVTSKQDAEGNLTNYDYFPADDPDGDRKNYIQGVGSEPVGYLREMTRDAKSDPSRNSGTNPDPARSREHYFYDPAGNISRKIDSRGIATDYIHNELNQLVKIIRASDVSQVLLNPNEPDWSACKDDSLVECAMGMVDFQYSTLLVYDANNNETQRLVQNLDSNNSDVAGKFIAHERKYDILDNLIEESHQVRETPRDTVVTKYRYDRNGNRVLEISPVASLPPEHPHYQPGNVLSYVFDERDRLASSTRGGLTEQFRTLKAQADISERSSIPNSPSLLTLTHHYDGNHNLIETIKTSVPTGNVSPPVTTYLYDGFDRQVSVIDPVGNQQFTQYDPASRAVLVSKFGPVGGPSPENNRAAAFRQPLRIGDIGQPLLSQQENKYDELGRRFEKNDRLFLYATVSYERKPVLEDGPLGQSNDGQITTRYEYDRLSRPTFRVADDLGTSQKSYDGVGRVILAIDAEGNQIAYSYDDNGNLVKIKETEITQHDAVQAGRAPDLKEVFRAAYVYDSLNRRIRATDNLGQTIRYQYDSRDNLILTSDAQNSADSADLIDDPLGLFPAPGQESHGVTQINRPGNTQEFFYDGANRRIADVAYLRVNGQGKNQIDTSGPSNPDGMVVFDYEWDANGRLVAVADDGSTPQNQNISLGVIAPVNPKGNVTRYTYNDHNRLIREMSADGSIAGYTYNAFDQIDTIIDRNGSAVHLSYNQAELPISLAITPAASGAPHPLGGFKAPNVSWQVIGTTGQTFEYDGLYRVTQSVDSDGPKLPSDDPQANVVAFAYDSRNHVIEEAQKRNEEPTWQRVSSNWDGVDNRVGLTYPNDRVIELQYDKLDRIKAIIDPAAKQNIVNYDYIGPTRVLRRDYPNGARLTYLSGKADKPIADVGYDGLKRVVSHRHLMGEGQLIRNRERLVEGFDYGYDRSNNKLFEIKLHDNNQREDYAYDSINRLVGFSRQGEAGDSWEFDGVNNWTSRQGAPNQVNQMNEYTSFAGTAQLYDANGNLIDNGTNLFQYDVFNRLRQVIRKADKAVMATYRYDAHHRRTDRTVTSGAGPINSASDHTRYFYNGWQEIEESRTRIVNGRPLQSRQQYVYGIWIDEPLTLDIDSNNDGVIDTRLFYHDDAKGCITALTNGQGVIVEGYTYDAYGRPAITSANGASLRESVVGNPYLFAGRRYDPETGFYYFRFRYLDPHTGRFLTPDPIGLLGDAGNRGNRYCYVGNNPVNHVDPLGLKKMQVPLQTAVSVNNLHRPLSYSRNLALVSLISNDLPRARDAWVKLGEDEELDSLVVP